LNNGTNRKNKWFENVLIEMKDIEYEMSRTQKNKATEYHIGLLKGKLARLRFFKK
jgi:ribosome-interacting GTPase 1